MAKIILVRHNDEPAVDRVLSYLDQHGFDADTRRPFAGDDMPSGDEPFDGAVIFGGLYNAFDIEPHRFLKREYAFIEECLKREVPLLGICQGAQMIAWHLGAKVGPLASDVHEFGYYAITPTPEAGDFLFAPLVVTQSHWHGFEVPDGATLLASSELFPNQAFRIGDKIYGLQFHAEVTPAGFRRAQDAGAARYGLPGVQSREEQTRLQAEHDATQADWFFGFLERLFPPAMAAETGADHDLRAAG